MIIKERDTRFDKNVHTMSEEHVKTRVTGPGQVARKPGGRWITGDTHIYKITIPCFEDFGTFAFIVTCKTRPRSSVLETQLQKNAVTLQDLMAGNSLCWPNKLF